MKTSYFAKSGKDPNAVSIVAYQPKWYHGRHYEPLAPPWSIVRLYKNGDIDEEEYEFMYRRQILDNLDPKQVMKDLGNEAILLCYEPPNEFCHRHITAQWLMGHLDIMIEEV
jgi:uncharacterized protein (DUF488 family)